jgi:hypothetical protein
MPTPSSAFATVNGIPIPVAEASRLETLIIGEEIRAASGTDLTSIRDTKEGWRFKLRALPPEEAGRWRGLLSPQVFSWSFNTDKYSDLKGLPMSGSAVSIDAVNKKYGAGSAKIDPNLGFGGGAGVLGFSAGMQINQRWTVMGWVLRGTVWHHLIVCQGYSPSASLGSGPGDPGTTITAKAFFLNGRKLEDYNTGGPVADLNLYNWANYLCLVGPGAPLLTYFPSSASIGVGVGVMTTWGVGQAITAGDVRQNLAGGQTTKTRWFIASNSGTTSNPTEPTWNVAAIGNTTNDNGITWVYQGSTIFNFDDVVFLPLDPSPITAGGLSSAGIGDYGQGNGWVDYLYQFCAQYAWPASPQLQMSGEAAWWYIRETTGNIPNILVQGKIKGSELVRGRLGYKNVAGLTTNQRTYKAAEKLELEFRQV